MGKLYKDVLLSNVQLLTISNNGLHDLDGGEIQKLYKSKSNESQRVWRQIGYPRFIAIYG